MGNMIPRWFTPEPSLSYIIPIPVNTPGKACIIASPRSISGLSKLPTWMFHSNFNQLYLPMTIGTYVVIHLEAADFCDPDEPTPHAQGHIEAAVYLNNDWLAFRINDITSGATHWLAMPHKMTKLSPQQRLQGWWAGQRTPGTPFLLPPVPRLGDTTQIEFPVPALSTASLLASQVSLGERDQDCTTPCQNGPTYIQAVNCKSTESSCELNPTATDRFSQQHITTPFLNPADCATIAIP